jgi:hypothetical protein
VYFVQEKVGGYSRLHAYTVTKKVVRDDDNFVRFRALSNSSPF